MTDEMKREDEVHKLKLEVIDLLMRSDPERGSKDGRRLSELASEVEEYEKAKFRRLSELASELIDGSAGGDQ